MEGFSEIRRVGINSNVGTQCLFRFTNRRPVKCDPAMTFQPISAWSYPKVYRDRPTSFPTVSIQDHGTQQARAPRTEEACDDRMAISADPV